MAKTIIEKILSSHAKKSLKTGDIGICDVDFCFSQDGTTSLVIDSFRQIKTPSLKKPKKYAMFIDHNAPSPNIGTSRVQQLMRDFSFNHGNYLFEAGCGISHQIMLEAGFVLPGKLVLGADSHAATGGILGACCIAVGSTDLAVTLVYGKNWFKVPPTVKIIINGKLGIGVFSKDIALEIANRLTASGANYKAIEYQGDVINKLSLDARATLTNMSIEFGAKTAIISPDNKVLSYLRKITTKRIAPVYPDKKAVYEEVREIDVSKLSPMLAKPHAVDNAVAVGEIEGIKIQQAFIGTCTNGRLEDLEIAARVLKGKMIHKDVKLLVAAASRKILEAAYRMGIIKVFIDSGAIVLPCGCGPCVGTHQGIPADGEVVVSTANRNFQGRMGNPRADIFLASPATVAASSIKGEITDPRIFLKRSL